MQSVRERNGDGVLWQVGLPAYNNILIIDFRSYGEGDFRMRMRKALLVEDSNGQREILSRILMEQGWWIIEAEDGKQAMKQMSEHDDIELIMLDLYMPIMDGMEFLSALRTTPEYSDAPKVLMMSVERAMPTVEKALAAGADEFIMKPFSIEVLEQKLSSMGFGETV